MTPYSEYRIEFRPCPRCQVDLAANAKTCEFCGLALEPQEPAPQPIIRRVKQKGRVRSGSRSY